MDLKLIGISESRRQDAVIHSSLPDASDQLPEEKAVECCEGSGTPRLNVSSVIDVSGCESCADGTLFEAGVLLTAGLDGESYEVPVPKEHDEEKTISHSVMQFPELLPIDGDPTGCSEVGFSNEACNVGLDSTALLIGVHDGSSPPGPPATLFDHHISGPCAEVDISQGSVGDVPLELPHPGVGMNMAPCSEGHSSSSPTGHDGYGGCDLSAEDCLLPLPHCPASLVNPQNLISLIEDLDSTLESIAQLTCKYNLVQSASEIVGNYVPDVNGSIDCCPEIDSTQPHVKLDITVEGFDPLSHAIQLLTKVEVLRPSLDALTPDHRFVVLLFLDNCLCNILDQIKAEFSKSF